MSLSGGETMSKNQTYLIVGAGCLIAVCAVVALVVGVTYIIPRYLSPASDIISVEQNLRPNATANSMGDLNAPIQMVEFGDFQCPFCERHHVETEPFLVSEYIETGKLHFTYRSAGNWVSEFSGTGNTESQDAAQAAYCAADQNNFWEMHDALFLNNRDVENQGSFSPRNLINIAESIELDMAEFQNCFDNEKYAERVQQDFDEALSLGVQGTPTFFVTYELNGETQTVIIEGAQPYQAFQQVLDQILADIGK
jgi:protein-disulfide isomerase